MRMSIIKRDTRSWDLQDTYLVPAKLPAPEVDPMGILLASTSPELEGDALRTPCNCIVNSKSLFGVLCSMPAWVTCCAGSLQFQDCLIS